jgi:hypothetical protein
LYFILQSIRGLNPGLDEKATQSPDHVLLDLLPGMRPVEDSFAILQDDADARAFGLLQFSP